MRFAVVLALILVCVTGLKLYRLRAAKEADQFPPSTSRLVTVPAQTAITATLNNGIVESAKPGDPVTAFVSQPVMVGDRVAIPSGSQLKGNLKDLSIFGRNGRATIDFTTVNTGNSSYDIHTQRVVVMTPLLSDTVVLGSALRALMGVSLGTAIGASSKDSRMIESGVIRGTWETMNVGASIPMTVVLIRDATV
jgi:hypothetical protein